LNFFTNSFSVFIESYKKPNLINLKIPSKKNTVVLGNDWITKLFIKKNNLSKYTNNINEAIKYNNIIIAYDCYRRNTFSFYEILSKILKKKKYILGKNIFIYQMFGDIN
ncbi:hypothetical protein IDG88_03620, partial [Pelagibacterales bacterium SAG-MED03]|nr:hypothetical protein [Pelagibacterales bacterium SAG-MED03]